MTRLSSSPNWKFISFSLVILSLVSLGFGLFSGTVAISPFDNLSQTDLHILWYLRLPRLLGAFLVGACLATAGATFQGLLQNPLADPYILGISSGAGFGAAIVIVLGIGFSGAISIGAFLGALATISFVYLLVKLSKSRQVLTYILAGVIINAFLSAIMMGLLFFAGTQLQGVIFWLMGDVSKTSLNVVGSYTLVVMPILIVLTRYGYALNIMSLGDDYARSVGINTNRFRVILFVLASLLTSISVSIGGMIGFVGLVIPHALRLVLKDDFRLLIPLSFLLGGLFLMSIDTLSRTLFSPIELPIGLVTSFIGAPIFIYLLVRPKKHLL